jgi:hypothetical protein
MPTVKAARIGGSDKAVSQARRYGGSIRRLQIGGSDRAQISGSDKAAQIQRLGGRLR